MQLVPLAARNQRIKDRTPHPLLPFAPRPKINSKCAIVDRIRSPHFHLDRDGDEKPDFIDQSETAPEMEMGGVGSNGDCVGGTGRNIPSRRSRFGI